MKKKTKAEIISDYLKNNYDVNKPIFINEVYDDLPSIGPNTVRTVFKRLVDDNKIERVTNGVYALYNEESVLNRATVFVSDIIKNKYLEKDGLIIGYISAINFATMLGLTTQTASIESIYTNNTSNEMRRVVIKGRSIILYAPKVPVTKNNYKLLQVLDLLNNFEQYSEYSLNDAKTKIIDYIKNINLSFSEIEKIVDKYPLKAQLNFYKIGAHYEFTQR